MKKFIVKLPKVKLCHEKSLTPKQAAGFCPQAVAAANKELGGFRHYYVNDLEALSGYSVSIVQDDNRFSLWAQDSEDEPPFVWMPEDGCWERTG